VNPSLAIGRVVGLWKFLLAERGAEVSFIGEGEKVKAKVLLSPRPPQRSPLLRGEGNGSFFLLERGIEGVRASKVADRHLIWYNNKFEGEMRSRRGLKSMLRISSDSELSSISASP
jgi:hypothetical protein